MMIHNDDGQRRKSREEPKKGQEPTMSKINIIPERVWVFTMALLVSAEAVEAFWRRLFFPLARRYRYVRGAYR